jgi:hypothetical protein
MHVHMPFARLAGGPSKKGQRLETEELVSKLDLIEEPARLTLEEFPQHLNKERQRMIIALVKHIRWQLADSRAESPDDPEATVRLPS